MSASFSLVCSNCVAYIWRSRPRATFSKPAVTLNRYFRRALAVATVVLAVLQGAQAQPSHTVSLETLQQEMAQRFPARYPVAGLFDLDVKAPQLNLLPDQDRLAANMAVQATGPALRRSHTGTFVVDFALRYEASDRTIRAYRLAFRHLRFPDLRPQATELLNTYGPALANLALQEVVLHQLRPQDLAMTDSLGMQPDSITVTDKGLVIRFVLKPL